MISRQKIKESIQRQAAKRSKDLNPILLLQRAQDLLESRVEGSDHDEVVLKQSRFWARAVTWTLIGGTGFGLIWLGTAQTEEIVVATGKLEPVSRVVDVQMPLQGVVKQMLVKDGDLVKKDQTLILLDTEASSERHKSNKEALKLKEAELSFKQDELEKTMTLTKTKLSTLEGTLILAKKILANYENLSDQGAVAILQSLEQADKVQQIEGEIQQLNDEQSRQISILEQNIRSLLGQIAEMRSRVAETTVTLRYQDITSPIDGIVFDLKPRGSGFVAQSSEPVLKVVPRDNLQANVEITSDKIGFVTVGKKADISIDSFPASDFGVIEGSVKSIGSDALPPDPGQNKGYRFPATIQLDKQFLNVNKTNLPLQAGMSLRANIKLRKVTYLQLILSALSQKTDSLKQL